MEDTTETPIERQRRQRVEAVAKQLRGEPLDYAEQTSLIQEAQRSIKIADTYREKATGRIFSVAGLHLMGDTFEPMVSANLHFDPNMVDRFFRHRSEDLLYRARDLLDTELWERVSEEKVWMAVPPIASED